VQAHDFASENLLFVRQLGQLQLLLLPGNALRELRLLPEKTALLALQLTPPAPELL
jgi:hypothetical protein